MTKKGSKRKLSETKVENVIAPLPAVRNSDEPVPKRVKWINKQRVLVFASRGISHRDRHLMEDIKKLMPHHKPESKMERSKTLSVINEMCEMKNCNKAMMFEGRKKKDLYMWMSNVPTGPSVKFLVENVYTMAELKLTGNCLRGSRPLLSFDPTFVEKPHYKLLKELLAQIFGVPKHHPKSQPFFDHVYTFSILDNRIWFRNFQILSEDGALAEVGPRFVLNPVKIFSGSFGGAALWENPTYTSPAKYRQMVRINAKNKYLSRMQQKAHAEATRPTDSYKLTPLEDIFQGDPLEKAKNLQKLGEKNEDENEENDKESEIGDDENELDDDDDLEDDDDDDNELEDDDDDNELEDEDSELDDEENEVSEDEESDVEDRNVKVTKIVKQKKKPQKETVTNGRFNKNLKANTNEKKIKNNKVIAKKLKSVKK